MQDNLTYKIWFRVPREKKVKCLRIRQHKNFKEESFKLNETSFIITRIFLTCTVTTSVQTFSAFLKTMQF
jgi:hypothetical protein